MENDCKIMEFLYLFAQFITWNVRPLIHYAIESPRAADSWQWLNKHQQLPTVDDIQWFCAHKLWIYIIFGHGRVMENQC